jgi:hypothetical protein
LKSDVTIQYAYILASSISITTTKRIYYQWSDEKPYIWKGLPLALSWSISFPVKTPIMPTVQHVFASDGITSLDGMLDASVLACIVCKCLADESEFTKYVVVLDEIDW